MAGDIAIVELDTKSATLSRMKTGMFWGSRDKEVESAVYIR